MKQAWNKQPYIIFYHDSCGDGSTAAVVMREFLEGTAPAIKATCVPVRYEENGDDIREALQPYGDKAVNVIIVDFCPDEATLNALANDPDILKLVVIDHHKTAQARVEGLNQSMLPDRHGYFDVSVSGAVLTWKFCQAQVDDSMDEDDMPFLVMYVGDYDMWKFERPHSREINAFLWNGDYSLARFGRLLQELEEPERPGGLAHAMAVGAEILAYQKIVAASIAKNGWLQRDSKGNLVYVVNASVPAMLVNLVADAVSETDKNGIDYVALFEVRGDGTKVSLRGVRGRETSVHVGELAQTLGGGGHKGAASYKALYREASWITLP